MTDKPILFSAPMVQALLADRKTQTRRLLPLGSPEKKSGIHAGKRWIRPFDAPAFPQWQWFSTYGAFVGIVKLRIDVGDRLYVREAWRTFAHLDKFKPSILPVDTAVLYEAGGYEAFCLPRGKFRQGMHLPRWGSRLTLPVKDIRVERLQDISEKDAIAEGIEQIHYEGTNPEYIGATAWKDYTVYEDGTPHAHAVAGWKSPVKSYESLWKTINGADSWDENPYVTAITFDVIKENIDKL